MLYTSGLHATVADNASISDWAMTSITGMLSTKLEKMIGLSFLMKRKPSCQHPATDCIKSVAKMSAISYKLKK